MISTGSRAHERAGRRLLHRSRAAGNVRESVSVSALEPVQRKTHSPMSDRHPRRSACPPESSISSSAWESTPPFSAMNMRGVPQEDGDRPGEAVGVPGLSTTGTFKLSYGLQGYGTEHPIMVRQVPSISTAQSLDHRLLTLPGNRFGYRDARPGACLDRPFLNPFSR